MSGEQELDRNEKATPYSLAEARKRGQVAKSAELTSALVLTAAAVLLCAQGWRSLTELCRLDHHLLTLAGSAAANAATPWWLWDLALHAGRAGMAVMLPLLAAVVVAAIVANLGQTGFVGSWQPLKPDWQRLNPMAGFKRFLTLRTLFDAGKVLVKLLVFGLVIGIALKDAYAHFSHLSQLPAGGYAVYAIEGIGAMVLKIGVALCLLAAVDAVFTHREFAKRMRMSRRQVREEAKQREGDPRIRARLRALRRELLKRSQALQRTANADIVITNPTHIAVALRYRHGQMDTPVLVSKGAGGAALVIRLVAARNRIPVVCSPTLARALHKQTEIDARIPTELYAGVARLMVWLLSARATRAPRLQQAEASR